MSQRVLIVDDVREIVHGLAAYFQQAGFATLVAYEGRAALELFRRERPDMIILDFSAAWSSGNHLKPAAR